MSEKYVISLIMEGNATLANELRLVMEEGCQHPGHGVTKSSREIVQDHLWSVC